MLLEGAACVKGWLLFVAGVAQLEEQLTCNQQVAGSSPIASSIECIFRVSGEVPEWSKGTDCKSVGRAFGGSNPPLSTTFVIDKRIFFKRE